VPFLRFWTYETASTPSTDALCGFANFASIAIQIGLIVPGRRNDLARLGPWTMAGGLLASYLTATVTGILI
jgi:concentrative nucleoside transporter, CNT family